MASGMSEEEEEDRCFARSSNNFPAIYLVRAIVHSTCRR